LSQLKQNFAKVKLGGGEKRIQNYIAKEKMTAQERIDYLLDPKAKCIEIGAFVGGMYADHGGCPSGGVVVKWDTSKGNNVLSLQMMPRKSRCLVPNYC
jgi:acetyl-CoA carboxylase carboxyltransferase component